MSVRILSGDVRAVVPTLADGSINSVVTSVPYWGLRSYLPDDHPLKALEIGSEPTVFDWVDTLVGVFDLIRPKLADDGTMFVNVGDSYCTKPRGNREGTPETSTLTNPERQDKLWGKHKYRQQAREPRVRASGELKEKDLVGQPWALAFALRAAGWYLRQDIIWAKKNPMPESTRDRFTKSHEYVFLLTKQRNYYWDFDAVAEPSSGGAHARRAKTPDGWDTSKGDGGHGSFHKAGREKGGVIAEGVGRRQGPPGNPSERKLMPAGSGVKLNESYDVAVGARGLLPLRNPRDVFRGIEDEWDQFQAWKAMMACEPIAPDVIDISSEPFKEAHFATFPQALIEPCIKAGCPPGGVVLDPFGGSGTTARVCERLHRDCVLIDIDERNAPMTERRIACVQKEILL